MSYTFIRGWKIVYNESKQAWFYETSEPYPGIEKPCKRCGKQPTPEGYDACMGYIEGAISACCGHGMQESFVKY